MLLGGWNVNPNINGMPQKVASAMSALQETLVGATYGFIAYLGSQTANGTNHAVLAKQTIVAGVDQKNIVLLKFNEKNMNCTLYGIETLLEAGPAFGGTTIEVATGKDIPEDAMDAFNMMMSGSVGTDVHPIAYLASQVTNGLNRTFAATVTPVYPNAVATVKLVTVNTVLKTVDFKDVI